jgi:hypothetical protein
MCLHRPAVGGARVVPSALRKYRESHRFLGPCCLCPLFAQDGRSVFVEAAIFIAISGPDAGYYVAKCAKGECGYLGQIRISNSPDDLRC